MGQELTTQRCCGMNNAYSTNSSIASPPSGLNASNDNDNTSIHTHSSHDRRSNVHQPSSSPNARKQRNTSHERRQQGGNSIDKGRHETKRKGNGRVGRARDRNTRHIPRRTQNEKLVVCGIGLYDELGPHVLRALHARFVRRKQTQRRRRIRARERSKGQNGTANGDASAGDLDSHSQHSHNEKDRSSTGGIGQEEGDVNAVDNDIEYRLIAIPSDCLSPASLLAAAERKKKRKKKEKEKEHARKKEREKKKNKERKKKNKKHRRKHKKKGKQKTQKDSIDDVEDDHAESSDSSDSSGSSDNDIENSDEESEDLSDSELTLSRERARERQNHTRRQQLLQAYQQDIPSLKITPHALQDVAESGREADRPDKLSKSYRHIIGALRGSAVCVLLTPSPAAVRMCFEAKVGAGTASLKEGRLFVSRCSGLCVLI